MTPIIKPISDHQFHSYPDTLLKDLIVQFKKNIAEEPTKKEICEILINDAYKVLGYRCALEYLEKYGD